MNSPLAALTWEMWRRGRRSVCLALGCLVFCAFVNLATAAQFYDRVGQILYGLGMVLSFLLTFGIFNYTEFSSSREWNGFPYRLFALPVRTWQLVTLPMFLGVVWVELVYVAWIKLVWTHADVPMAEWFGLVLGAYMFFYHTVLWGLAGFRIIRIIALGLGGVSSIAVACLPMFGKIVPSPWFSEARLVPIVAGSAFIAFVIAWATVDWQRHGGGVRQSWIRSLMERIADAMPRRATDFGSPAMAQFWFEWRRSGLLLPGCSLFALLAIFGPISWIDRHDPDATLAILPRLLAMPIVLAFAIGKGFIKPEFWSMNLAMPSVLAVRPISCGEIVVSKMRVAALTVAMAWGLVLGFIALWLPFWADTMELNKFLYFFRFLYPHSWLVITVFSLGGLIVLTWRMMVSGLWVGLSGKRLCYFGSPALQITAAVLGLVVIGIWSPGIDSQIRRYPSLVIGIAGWILAIAVVLKLWLAVISWSRITRRRTWQYVLIWSSFTLCFIALGILSPSFAADTFRLEHLIVLGALLVFPITRLGLAPSFLAKNRHGLNLAFQRPAVWKPALIGGCNGDERRCDHSRDGFWTVALQGCGCGRTSGSNVHLRPGKSHRGIRNRSAGFGWSTVGDVGKSPAGREQVHQHGVVRPGRSRALRSRAQPTGCAADRPRTSHGASERPPCAALYSGGAFVWWSVHSRLCRTLSWGS
jgi:hypothetical protein